MDNLYIPGPHIDEAKTLVDALERVNKGRLTTVHYHAHLKPCNEKCFVPVATKSK